MPVQDRFIIYSDYFALAAESGLERARALFPSIKTSTLVDVFTMESPANSDVATANFTRGLDTAYEFIWTDGQFLSPIMDAFRGLENYILKKSNLTVEDFLTQEGIKVDQLYITLQNIVGTNDVNSSHAKE